MDRRDEDPEGQTKALFRSIALERAGYYDAVPGGRPRLSFWQRRIRGIVRKILDRRLKESPAISRVLDAGCGRGDFTLEIASRYPQVQEILGCDFSPELLDLARAAGRLEPRVRFSVGDLTSLPFENGRVELSICLNVLHHIPHDRLPLALGQLARVSTRAVILEIKNAHSPYFRMHGKRVEGVPIFPATMAQIRATLETRGFTLAGRYGVFGVRWLSPLVVLHFEKDGTLSEPRRA